jgi:UDPglucose 6-dehydrogenase
MPSSERRVAVVGAGYVGLATAVGLASLGHTDALVEIDPRTTASLEAGRLPIHEPGMDDAFAAVRADGRLTVANAVPADATVAFVCVGTPIDEAGRIDLASLDMALAGLRDLANGGVPICIRSTLPPGGSADLARRIDLPRRQLLTNPEFLAQADALNGFLRPARIVIGRFPETAEAHVELLLDLFAQIDAPRMTVDVATAELIKNGANAYLAMRISFVNELAALADAYGADPVEVMDGLGHDPRIGRGYATPSAGIGGSCLPNASLVLDVAARSVELDLSLMPAISLSNRQHRTRFVEHVVGQATERGARHVAVIGLAFKPGTDDVRDSVAVELCRALLDAGFAVTAYDPLAADNAGLMMPSLRLASSAEEAAATADLTVTVPAMPRTAPAAT